jgi:opacity protein-like surface antigen
MPVLGSKWVFFLGVLLVSAAAMAEPPERPFTLFAGADHGWFGDDEGSLGDGAGFLAGFEYRPWSRIGIQGHAARSSHRRGYDDGTRYSGDQTVLDVSLVYHFPGIFWSSYVMGGVAHIHSERESRVPNYRRPGEVRVSRSDQSQAAWHLGAGLDIPLHRNLALRPELRLLAGRDYVRRYGASLAVALRW